MMLRNGNNDVDIELGDPDDGGAHVLAPWAISHDNWCESARGVITDGWEIDEVSEVLAHDIMNKILRKEISIDQLRQGVVWANALEEEAQICYGSDLTIGDFKFERTARRIMHHAGKLALDQVKNRRRRTIMSVRRGNPVILK